MLKWSVHSSAEDVLTQALRLSFFAVNVVSVEPFDGAFTLRPAERLAQQVTLETGRPIGLSRALLGVIPSRVDYFLSGTVLSTPFCHCIREAVTYSQLETIAAGASQSNKSFGFRRNKV
jgi:hypothetical protein